MVPFKDLSAFMPLTSKELTRIFRNVRKEKNGCWIWTGGKDVAGYGLMTLRGNRVSVHRLLHEAMVGHIPDGFVVDHLCRVPACCNPEHLEAVTQKVNVGRAKMPSGHNHHFGRRKHCVHGHPFSGKNLRLAKRPRGICRMCRTCARIGQARRKRRTLSALVAATGLPESALLKLVRVPLRDLRKAGILPPRSVAECSA
jgi:hypothetical protein